VSGQPAGLGSLAGQHRGDDRAPRVVADRDVAPGRLPDFFIAGPLKAGTTALFEMLRLHPQIFMPDRKEPRFFASEMYYRDAPRPGGTPKTLEEYLTWFEGAGPDQRVGEASPSYLWSPGAAARIAEVQPSARIIAILREPASLLRSLHLEFVQIYVETETDLRTALALEGPRREGKRIPRHTYWPPLLLYSDHVRYVEQLRRYHARFPREQVLVLIYDDFRADNAGTLRGVLRFLEVDETVPLELRDANPTIGLRSQRMHEALHAVSVGHGPASRAIKESIKAVTPRWLRRGLWLGLERRFLYTEPPAVDEDLMTELRTRFKPEVVALSEYLDRDLVTLWGYDRLP
jgi:sulfotransferase family protein